MPVVVNIACRKMNVNRNTGFGKILRFWKGNKKPISLGQTGEKGDKFNWEIFK